MSRIITNAEAQKKLKPAGSIAFDVPAEPFGVSQMIAEAAVGQGIILTYDSVADSPEKCRVLLQQAGFEATTVKTGAVSDHRTSER